MAYLGITASIFWITLIEEITVGICNEEADCFSYLRSQPTIKSFQRVNCSIFELDNDTVLTCYKTGFYLIEAFSTSGGLLYIITSSARILFPLATGGDQRSRRIRSFITILFLFIVAIAIALVSVILPFNLPATSLLLVNGVIVFPIYALVIGPVVMTCLICFYPG